MRKLRYRWAAAFALAALTALRSLPVQAAEAPAAEPAQRAAPPASPRGLDPGALLLLSVALDDLTLSDGLGAYGSPDDPLAPVGELARLLEADIDISPSEGRITGRLGQARSPLFVDLRVHLARVAGREIQIAFADAVVTPTEIYLHVSDLQKLLPLRIDVSTEDLALRLRALEPFPVQARLERLAHRPDGSKVATADEPELDVPSPYAFFTPPGFDVVLDGGFQSGARNRNFRYDVRAAGDLAWANFQGYLGSDEVGRASSARVLLQRRSIEGGLLGPLKAREISVGDTFAPGLALGPRVVAGRGISFSTAPLEQTNVFNRIDLRGDLPPGYDVEIYVNDVLKGSTNQSINGRFEFLDVPLSPGVNVVRLVTYGPRGERNEEVQVVNVGAALLRPGEAQLTFGIVDQDESVIRVRRLERSVLGDPALFAPSGARIVAGLNFGITDLLSATAGAARVPQIGGGALGLYTVGARTSLFGVATQVDGAWNSRGGQAYSLGLAGQFGSLSTVLRHAEYRDGFVDENNLGFNSRLELRRRDELTVDSSLNLRGRIVPVSLRAIRNEYAGGANDILAAWRASSSLGQVLVSAGWEYQRQAYRPAKPVETLTGYLAASTFRSYSWQIRTTLDYELLPSVKARFLALTIDHRLSDAWTVRFGLGEPLERPSGWNVSLSSIYATRYGDLALTGEYDNTDQDWRVAAQWSFGLGWDPSRNRYDLTRTGPGSGGSVLFNAFMDENGDGIRQASEAPAPNVGLEGGGQRGLLTGKDGRLLVTGLGSGPRTRMDVNLERLDDPSVSTPPSRLSLRPRPGRVSRVDYPMRPTGGVAIKVELLRDDGKRVGLSSVRLQLAPDTGPPVQGVTEFDGSAVFDAVPIGRYRLQLDPRQAEKLRMRLVEEPTVLIRGGGDFAPDVTVQVRFLPPAAETTVARQESPSP